MLRVFVLAVIALICGALLEGSVGAWGGMVRKRAPSTGALLASLLCFSGFSIAAEAAWPASWSFDGDRWAVLAPDGSSAVIGWWDRGMARGLKWSQEDGLSWGDKDDLDRWSVYPGPGGATVARGSITWPSGAVTTCDSDIYVYSEACWDPNGDALFLSLRHSRRFAMATPNGCALLSRDIQRPQFLPDGDVVFIQENELFAGKDIASATRIPVPGHESTTGTLWFESNRRTTYVARQTTEGDAASMEHTVWQLNAGALTQLMTGTGKPRLWNECVWTSGPGTANARESKTISCWTPAGEPLFKEYSTDRRMLPIGHGWLFDSGRFIGEFSGREVEAGLFRPSDGMKIPLPRHGSRLRWNGDFALLGPKQLRLISPDGSIKDIALPPE
jgi:hypothetical protein